MSARSVFITGAAAGIGRRTALLLAERGWSVGAYDIDEAGLATLVDEVAPLAGSVVTGRLDVTDADAFATAVSDFAGRHGGRLDVLVNNAGILLAGPSRTPRRPTTTVRSTSTSRAPSTACTRRTPTCGRPRARP